MPATAIEMFVPLKLPPVAAREGTMHVMRAIGAHEPPYENLSLSLRLRDLAMPGEGELHVPVQAHVVSRPQEWECRVTISAAQDQRFFPTFEGVLTVTPDGRSECELWLQGHYEPPMGALGRGINVTLLRGAAKRSLRTFLEWLAAEVVKAVAESERERMRQSRGIHA